jgi:xanthine dehydrogenase accessory factor
VKEGFDAEELKKVRAPIGLDIGAVSPEEVALAILAEIVAERRGGTANPCLIGDARFSFSTMAQ